MTTLNVPQDMHRVFEECDPIYLRQLREAAGIEIMVLARTACLSVTQVRHLEGDGDGMFYSPSIKRQAYKRLLMILGAEPPMATSEEAIQAAHHGLDKAQHNPIDRIVALAEHTKPLQPTLTTWSSGWLPGMTSWHKVWAWGILGGLVLGGVYMAQEFAGVSWFSRSTPSALERVSPVTMSTTPRAEVETSPVSVSPADLASSVASHAAVSNTPVSTLPLSLASKSTACAHSTESFPELVPTEAHKVGNYVYLVSDKPMTVCVVDGTQQATWLELKPGEGHSVYGKSPWQLTGEQLYQAQIYFQGRRLTLPEGRPQRLSLVEKPLTR